MPLQVSYMGTKRQIAPQVASIILDGPSGPLLDLFSGVCAIGSAVGPDRQVWCNDVQQFASTVAEAFFLSTDPPIHFNSVADAAYQLYRANSRKLERRYRHLIDIENLAFESRDPFLIGALEHEIPHVSNCVKLEKERKRLSKNPGSTPYRLFSITFAGGYFGISQCIQIDSIRYAIDELAIRDELDEQQRRWLCLALCQATSKIASTTGHFAQYLKIKKSTVRRFLAQRRRSAWSEWLRAIADFTPVGTRAWRSNNRVFRKEATELLTDLDREGLKPATIYADPPYTADHYSRYYHLYETLLKYDYPPSSGTGRYRPDRFQSYFSTKTKVADAIELLIAKSARLGSRLVLSYPEAGLLSNPEPTIISMLRRHYGFEGTVVRLDHCHSSLGASKGTQKRPVGELVFATG